MADHTTDGIAFVDDPTGTLNARRSDQVKFDDAADMGGKVWCAICVDYGFHDTVHHDSQGGFKAGDMAELTDPPMEYQHLKGKRGRVEGARGSEVTVAIPSKSGTITISVPAKALTPDV